MPRRIAIVGTDTEIGKTHLVEALLHAAHTAGIRVLPFKPAQSGTDRPSDAARLAAATTIDVDADAICPLTYTTPLAPGIAHDRASFLAPGSATDPAPLRHVLERLERLERRHDPDLVLIEGAGGLHVPMPGGEWLDQWIVRMTPRTLIVGRTGLGTINHTLLTAEALRARGLDVLGFVHIQRDAPTTPDPSRPDNAAILAARGLRHLGTLPHGLPEASALQAVAAPILRGLLEPPAA